MFENNKYNCFILIFFLLFATDNLYTGWLQQISNTNVNLNCINFHHGNENMAWSCGDNGVILFTSNGGSNWIAQNSGTQNDLFAVCFMEGPGSVFAVGENGTILRTTNWGTNWLPISSPTDKTLRDISDFNFIAVGDSGLIMKSTNQGLNWNIISSPTTQNLNAIAASFTYYAAGDNGTVLRGLSQGTSWQTLQSGTNENLYGLPLFGNTDIIVGNNGLIWRSTNFGVNWFYQPSGTSNRLTSVEFSVNNNSRIYVCGYNGVILKSTNDGTNWGFQISTVTEHLNSIFFYLDDYTGYACGNNGIILKTTDGGGPIFTSISKTVNDIPQEFALAQNYPNPFNPATKIKFEITNPKSETNSKAEIRIYDLIGSEVSVLVNEELIPGTYEVEWDASKYASGVYFYKINVGNFTATKKMILIK